jgi:DNA modification methylase
MSRPFDLRFGDCREVMRAMPDNSVDSIVCDPPYELGFMGKAWDASGIANNPAMWAEALRVLKPGGHLLAFSGSRTYHRMACAIEDAGFEIRDQIQWIYGSGFPKSLDVSKAIDKMGGAVRTVIGTAADFARDGASRKTDGSHVAPHSEQGGHGFNDRWAAPVTAPATDAARQWEGWGTALKPAHEPICVARKPLSGTVAANVLAHGTGALNIDGCRVAGEPWKAHSATGLGSVKFFSEGDAPVIDKAPHDLGRWAANIIHDGSDEVLDAFTGDRRTNPGRRAEDHVARFFYCAKASKSDRGDGNTHPTVKPTDLMAYLCRLVTPPGGLVFDPFMGSGSTGKAAVREGFRFIGCDMTPEYLLIAAARIGHEWRKVAP